MNRLKNFLAYLVVIVGIYLEFKIIIGIWSFIVLMIMAIGAGICSHKITVQINQDAIPLHVKIKYDLFYSFWTKQHLPAWLDAALYSIIIVLSAINDMWFTSTAWLAISYFDFKVRDLAMKEQSDLIAYAILKGAAK
jgi:hypothetical protein